MRLWKQAFLIVVVAGSALVAWAFYLPAAQPFLDRLGALTALERIGLVNAAQREPEGGTARRGGMGVPTVTARPVTSRVMNVRSESIGTAKSLKSVVLSTEISGQIERLNVVSGARVRTGEVIAELDDQAAQIAVDRAMLTVEDETRKHERLSRLRATGAAAETQLQDSEVSLKAAELALRNARYELGRHRILAPIDGWVGILSVNPGELVSAGSQITTIEDRTSLLVDFRVPERLASRIHTGDRVRAAPVADPGQTLDGTVSAIDNRVDEASRTLRLQATLPNAEDHLRPGMAIALQLDVVGDSYPVVDPLSIQWGPNGAYVWVIRDGKSEQQPVRIVQRNAADALVAGDFTEGDLVVVEGVMSLRQGREASVAGTESAETAAPGTPAVRSE